MLLNAWPFPYFILLNESNVNTFDIGEHGLYWLHANMTVTKRLHTNHNTCTSL